MGVPTFNPTENALKFTIYDDILRLWQKVKYLAKFSPSDTELFYCSPSIECAVPHKWRRASKGLERDLELVFGNTLSHERVFLWIISLTWRI